MFDNSDDMDLIKRKILEADVLILASPVYLHNVSGSMKNFLDRISTWAHVMRLAGKYGVVITTTSNNGNIYVQDYLKSIATYLGLQLIGGYNIFVDIPNELYNQLKRKEIIERCCFDIKNALITKKESNFFVRRYFFSFEK